MSSKSHNKETQTTNAHFAECMEQMISACGPEMKKWMEACASNMSEECSSCCDMQTKPENTGKE